MLDGSVEIAMRQAIRNKNDEGFFRLLDQHPEGLWVETTFGSWLHFAASRVCLNIVKRLVELGADVNRRGGISEGGAIRDAASNGELEVVKFLQENGAELDVSDPTRNPLFGAIHDGHTAVAKLLIDSGIDIRVKYTGENMKGMDALRFAREWWRDDIAKLLIEKLASDVPTAEE